MGGGAHLRMDLPQPEDGQRLREAVRHRRGLHLRGYDADHGEAVSQCLGLSRQSLKEKFSEVRRSKRRLEGDVNHSTTAWHGPFGVLKRRLSSVCYTIM